MRADLEGLVLALQLLDFRLQIRYQLQALVARPSRALAVRLLRIADSIIMSSGPNPCAASRRTSAGPCLTSTQPRCALHPVQQRGLRRRAGISA